MDHFFTGLHQPSDAGKTDAGCISVVRLRRRKAPLPCTPQWPWIMDSGAFSALAADGGYRSEPREYAAEIQRWTSSGTLMAAVAEDYMCEPFMLEKTGLTVTDHQRLTIERYDALVRSHKAPVPIMPVLQGYAPADYAVHARAYGDRLGDGMWVGVGTLCKRNGDIAAIEDVLLTIKRERPDLRLHGFGIKTTALASALVRDLLHSADSMAWSYAARRQGRNPNAVSEARRFARRIETVPQQTSIFAHLGP